MFENRNSNDRNNNNDGYNDIPHENSQFSRNVLLGLLGVVALLFFIGYKFFSSNESSTTESLQVAPPADTTIQTSYVSPAPVIVATPTPNPTPEGTGVATAQPIKTVQPQPSTNSNSGAVKIVNGAASGDNSATAKAPAKTPAAPAEVKGVKIEHIVGPGETFLGIANRYNLKSSTLQALNPTITPEGLKSGATHLTVKVKAIHKVGVGDILKVVAQKYGCTVEQLMTANKKTKNISNRGEELIIPFGTTK